MKTLFASVKTLIISLLLVFLYNSCSHIRFEEDGIVIEAELDGKVYPILMYNTEDGFDIDDETTFDILTGEISLAGKEVKEVKFTKDPVSYEYKNTDPKKEVTMVMYDYPSWSGEYDYRGEDYHVAEVTTSDLKPGYWYKWETAEKTLENIGKIKKRIRDYEKEQKELEKENIENNSSNPLVGKWMQMNECSNSSGESNWFIYNSDGRGQNKMVDCNSLCTGGGIKLYFNYTVSGNSINMNWTAADDYCGIENKIPSPTTYTYSLSGDILTINGLQFKRQ
jgi:hypothetical protein